MTAINTDFSNFVEMESYRLQIKDASVEDLIDEYGRYYALRKTNLFDEEMQMIKAEISDRCAKAEKVTE